MSCIYSRDSTQRKRILNWIARLFVFSKGLRSDVLFIVSNRIDYISAALANQEQAVRVIKYSCRSEKNCKLCEKIQQYKASVHNSRQEFEEVRKSIFTWKVAALNFAHNVNSFLLYLADYGFDDDHEEMRETEMQEEGATEQRESSREQQHGVVDDSIGKEPDDGDKDNSEDETDDDDSGGTEDDSEEETKERREKIIADPVSTTEQEFLVCHGKYFSIEALEWMFYKIKEKFCEFRQAHHSHLCTLLGLMHRTEQEEIKREIAELVKEIM